MSHIQPTSIPKPAGTVRHAQQEVVDLLAAALLRLRAHQAPDALADSEPFGLAFSGHQRVNTNHDHTQRVRK